MGLKVVGIKTSVDWWEGVQWKPEVTWLVRKEGNLMVGPREPLAGILM